VIDGDPDHYRTDLDGLEPPKRMKRARTNGHATPSLWPTTLQDLARSGLNATDAAIMGIEDVSAEWCAEHVLQNVAGYRIPYLDLDRRVIKDFYRVRHFIPAPRTFGGKQVTRSGNKYMQPEGSGVRAYLSALIDWREMLADNSIALTITEGEKKAHAACKAGFPTVGLGGVWNFRQANGALLDELAQLAHGRKVIICFDSDRLKNKQIRHAEMSLTGLLRNAGAQVYVAAIPASDDDEKQGLDDMLMAKGAPAVRAVLESAVHITIRELIKGIRDAQKSNHARHGNVAQAVVAELKAAGRFYRTDESLLYFDGASKTLITLDDKSRELRAFIDERTGITAACPEWSQIYERAADTAFNHGERAKVAKLSRWDAASGSLYIAQSPSRLFKITPEGWGEVDNGTDGVLIQARKLAAITVSKVKGHRADFESIINVPNFIDGFALSKKQARMLWAIYFFALFFPEALPTRPIVLAHGPKGSSKSTGGRAVLLTIFGPGGQVTVINPKKLDAVESVIVNDAVAVLDNIDGRHPDIQNILAVAATGGMLKARTLYTTMGQSEVRIDSFPMVTSRDPKSFTRDDVVDRLLYLQVDRREDFKAESEMIAEINAARPRVWRWLLDQLPAVVSALQAAKGGILHADRMADFSRFALAVGPVLGFPVADVRAALTAMGAEKLHFEAEYSPLLGAIGLYIDQQAEYLARCYTADATAASKKGYETARESVGRKMRAAELLAVIKTAKPDFSYTSAPSFGQALKNEATAIASKFHLKISEDKKQKVLLYELAPQGGYLTWEAHQKAIKQGKNDENAVQ